MNDQYHITQPGGAPHGPYDVSTLQAMLMRGDINQQTLCFKEGMQEWVPISMIIPMNNIMLVVGNSKSRIAYILLGIFLGTLGIHNFFAGYVIRGLVQLLITVCSCGALGIVVFIWNLIEICTVTADSRGVPFS